MEMELCPLSYILNRTLDLIFARDTEELFHEPVNADEVDIYLTMLSVSLFFSSLPRKFRVPT